MLMFFLKETSAVKVQISSHSQLVTQAIEEVISLSCSTHSLFCFIFYSYHTEKRKNYSYIEPIETKSHCYKSS